ARFTVLRVSGKGLVMWMYWPVADVLGNRDDPPPLPAWAWRADRAHRNMLENFPHFAALVLLTNLAGLANPLTALGATIFFWARLAHAVLYISACGACGGSPSSPASLARSRSCRDSPERSWEGGSGW